MYSIAQEEQKHYGYSMKDPKAYFGIHKVLEHNYPPANIFDARRPAA
jgi:hypothetical protein